MDHLLTEARNLRSADLDRLTPLEFVRLMNAEDALVNPAIAAEADKIAKAIVIIADRFQRGGRLIYAGAGTSGRLGVLDASECPPTFNSNPAQVVGLIAGGPKALTTAVEGAEDHPEFAEADLAASNLNANDVLVGIATSGRTPYVLGALRYARSVGASPIGFTCVPDSELVPLCDLVIAPLVGPEILTGSTRLKAGTATKLVLNMLTTGAMVRTGKTYGNLMVDLRATNTKLKARSNRMVRHFTNLDAIGADELLNRCNGELKTAIVAQLSGVDPNEARQRLIHSGGSIRATLRPGEAGVTSIAVSAVSSDLILGIDGGGSNTTALLARLHGNNQTIIGKGRSGPSNLRSVGEPAAFRALDDAIAAAFLDAGLLRVTAASVVFGLAGAGRQVEQTLVKNWAAQQYIAQHIEVVSDSSLLLAMLPQQWGIAVVAGTGSGVWGRTPDGRTVRAGGWGPLLGDEGSAYKIALAGIRAVLGEYEGCDPKTDLTPRLLECMELKSPDELIPALHGGDWDRTRIAGLASTVIQAALNRDGTANHIVRSAAGDLTNQVHRVAHNLATSQPINVAFGGGLFLNHKWYQELVVELLDEPKYGGIALTPGQIHLIDEPAEGALRIAASAPSLID